MPPHHLAAIILLLVGLLLIQTARASYWRGVVVAQCRDMDHLVEGFELTRCDLNEAKDTATRQAQFLQEQYARLTMRQAAPAVMDELIAANGLLRSFSAIVEREGKDTNWEGLDHQLTERLQSQHAMIYARQP